MAVVWGVAFPGTGEAHAQVRPDSIRTDTLRRPGAPTDSVRSPVALVDSATNAAAQRRVDSIAAFRRADTIKAPLAQFERPLSLDVDERLRFSRDQILRSEATNLSELLAMVPGVTQFATGWIASAHLASYAGDFARIRVFIDGLELDNNDTRSNGINDFIDVHLWLLDEIVIERAAGEIRVWCNTLTNNRVTPYTRTDVFTGDLNTNGFRALFGRRFTNGMLLQVNGEQFATQQGRQSIFGGTTAVGKGDGGNQVLNARVGFARRKISVDVYGLVTTRDRQEQTGLDSNPSITAYKGARREMYARVGYGDTSSGLWSQAVFSALRTRLEGIRPDSLTDTTVASDTTRSREQKMFAIGYRTKSMQFSFTERLRTFGGRAWSSPALRFGYANGLVAAGVFAERHSLDSSRHIDGTVRFAPVTWAAVSASQTVRVFDDGTAVDMGRRNNETQTRIEGGVRWHDKWFTLGAIRQSAIQQKPPTLLTGFPTPVDSAAQSLGLTFGARGNLYKEIGIDVQGVRWDKSARYRPQLSVRTDLSLVTNWLSRFPRGEFGVNAHVIHEYRDPMVFGYAGTTINNPIFITSLPAQIFTALLEIRIQRATLFYHFHNVTGQAYELVPGIVMPRQVQMYGVRWEFWN